MRFHIWTGPIDDFCAGPTYVTIGLNLYRIFIRFWEFTIAQITPGALWWTTIYHIGGNKDA